MAIRIQVVYNTNHLPVQNLKYKITIGNIYAQGITDSNGYIKPIETTQNLDGQKLTVQVFEQSTQKYSRPFSILISGGITDFHILAPEITYSFPTKKHDGEANKGCVLKKGLPEETRKGVLTVELFLQNYEAELMKNKTVQMRDEKGNPIIKVCAIGDKKISFPKMGLTDADFAEAGSKLNIEPDVIKAFYIVEAAGKGFLPCGIPKILYERHYVYRLSGRKKCSLNNELNRELSSEFLYVRRTDKNMTKEKFDKISPSEKYQAGLLSWLRVLKAKKKGFSLDIVLQSVSWGGFQVLGHHYNKIGYENAIQLANDCFSSEKAHLSLFVGFCKVSPKIHKALQKKDWYTAALYNGSRDQVRYKGLLEKAYANIKNKESK